MEKSPHSTPMGPMMMRRVANACHLSPNNNASPPGLSRRPVTLAGIAEFRKSILSIQNLERIEIISSREAKPLQE